MADEIGGEDYAIFVDAATGGAQPAAAATLAWYKIWSEVSRADSTLLVHAEAMAYDPDTESTPQFDPVAVMLALELLSEDCTGQERITLFEMDAIHFYETGEGMLWYDLSLFGHERFSPLLSLGCLIHRWTASLPRRPKISLFPLLWCH